MNNLRSAADLPDSQTQNLDLSTDIAPTQQPRTEMQVHAYRADKILHHPDRLLTLARGETTVPVTVKISISDLCNHDCSFCSFRMEDNSNNQWFGIETSDGRRNNPLRRIHTAKVLELLSDMSHMGVRAIEFTGGGEPTAHPEHAAIFEHCLALGMDAGIITNGQLVSQNLDPILDRFTWVRISIDAALSSTWARVRRVSAKKFPHVLRNAQRLINHRNAVSSQTHIGAGFVVYEENWEETYEAVKLYKTLGFDSVRISALFNTTQKLEHFRSFSAAASDLCKKAKADFEDEYFQVVNNFDARINDLLLAGQPNYDRCFYQELVPYIGGDLNLYRCCNTAYNPVGFLASLEGERIEQIWNSLSKSGQLRAFRPDKACSACMFNNRNFVIANVLGRDVIPDQPAHPPPHINFV